MGNWSKGETKQFWVHPWTKEDVPVDCNNVYTYMYMSQTAENFLKKWTHFGLDKSRIWGILIQIYDSQPFWKLKDMKLLANQR